MRSLVTRDTSVLERANADRARASRFSARTNHGWSRAAQQSIPVSSLPVRATSFAIEYRDDDNKSQITREDGTVIAYDYDDANRLVEEKWTASDQTVLHHFQYTYDPTGNRLTKTYNGTTTDYDYNALNQLTQEQTGSAVTEYAYDRDGNTIRKAEPSKTTWYSWNHENMLTKAVFSDATPTNYFGYDVDSVRVEKVDSGGRKQYHWAAHELQLVRDGITTLETHVRGHGQIPPLLTLAVRETSDDDYCVSHDPFASFNAMTQLDTEAVQYTIAVDAWGTLLASSGTPIGIELRFLESEFDADTDLSYLLRRYLDLATGRFLSRDPIGDLVRTVAHLYVDENRYAYALNNPGALVDPLGLVPLFPGRNLGFSIDAYPGPMIGGTEHANSLQDIHVHIIQDGKLTRINSRTLEHVSGPPLRPATMKFVKEHVDEMASGAMKVFLTGKLRPTPQQLKEAAERAEKRAKALIADANGQARRAASRAYTMAKRVPGTTEAAAQAAALEAARQVRREAIEKGVRRKGRYVPIIGPAIGVLSAWAAFGEEMNKLPTPADPLLAAVRMADQEITLGLGRRAWDALAPPIAAKFSQWEAWLTREIERHYRHAYSWGWGVVPREDDW